MPRSHCTICNHVAGVDRTGNLMNHEARPGLRCVGTGSVAHAPEADAPVMHARPARREPARVVPERTHNPFQEKYVSRWAQFYAKPEHLGTYLIHGEQWTIRDWDIAKPFVNALNEQRNKTTRRKVSEQGPQYPFYGGGSGGSVRAVNAGLFSPR